MHNIEYALENLGAWDQTVTLNGQMFQNFTQGHLSLALWRTRYVF